MCVSSKLYASNLCVSSKCRSWNIAVEYSSQENSCPHFVDNCFYL